MKATIQIKRGGRVLVVEDNVERQDWFVKHLLHEPTWYADDPGRVLAWFEEMSPQSFTAIFLDYDLGPEPIQNSTITSKPVIEYLNAHCPTRREQRNIIIHTGNRPAGDWAQALLPGALRLPFGTFKIEEKEQL